MNIKRFVLSVITSLLLLAAPVSADIKRIEASGIYADALPRGEYAYLPPARNSVVTHLGSNSAPEVMMFVRITNKGGFKIATKANFSDNTWMLENGQWKNVGVVSYGVQGHQFDASGNLHVMQAARDQESQGFRYWDPSAPAGIASYEVTGQHVGFVSGSASYNPFSPLAIHYGVTRLYEWTKCGDAFIGQGDVGGTAVQYRGNHYLLEGGDSRFVQAHCDGPLYSVAVTKLATAQVVLLWFNESDITQLPEYTGLNAPTPKPEPAPTPPPTSEPVAECGEVPQRGQDVLRQLWARPDVNTLVRSANDDDRRKAALMFAEQMAFSIGPEWGTKNAGGGRPQSKDAISKYVGATLCGWDIVNGSTRELSFGHGEPLPGQEFIRVTPTNHLGVVTPPPPVDPPPADNAELKRLKARITELETQLTAITVEKDAAQAHISRLMQEKAELQAKLDAIASAPPPTCIVTGPGWVRSLFGITCKINN